MVTEDQFWVTILNDVSWVCREFRISYGRRVNHIRCTVDEDKAKNEPDEIQQSAKVQSDANLGYAKSAQRTRLLIMPARKEIRKRRL